MKNIKVIFSTIIFLLSSSFSFASQFTFQGFGVIIDGEKIQPVELNRVQDIMEVANYVKKLATEQKIAAKDIVVIFDVDGVLTNQPEPVAPENTTASPNAVAAVQAIIQQGATAIASSAWVKPKESYERLIKIGLKDAFKLDKDPEFVPLPQHGFICFTSGNFASVKNYQADQKYFRQKAFAPHAVLQTIDTPFKYVIFVDDTYRNIEHFHGDVLGEFKPYKDGTHITYFYME